MSNAPDHDDRNRAEDILSTEECMLLLFKRAEECEELQKGLLLCLPTEIYDDVVKSEWNPFYDSDKIGMFAVMLKEYLDNRPYMRDPVMWGVREEEDPSLNIEHQENLDYENGY